LLLERHESERAVFTFSRPTSDTYYGYTNNMAVRRHVFDRCGVFMEIMRGADSLFVRKVLDAFSCDAVCYAPSARVRHLEIDGVHKWLRKRFIYGRSFQETYWQRTGASRLITPAESSLILTGTIRRNNYGSLSALCLAMLLLAGTGFYFAGRFAGLRPRITLH
jgi:hypothetical protein